MAVVSEGRRLNSRGHSLGTTTVRRTVNPQVAHQVQQGEPKDPECESVQDFYFIPIHYSLLTKICIQDFLKVISKR